MAGLRGVNICADCLWPPLASGAMLPVLHTWRLSCQMGWTFRKGEGTVCNQVPPAVWAPQRLASTSAPSLGNIHGTCWPRSASVSELFSCLRITFSIFLQLQSLLREDTPGCYRNGSVISQSKSLPTYLVQILLKNCKKFLHYLDNNTLFFLCHKESHL